MNYDFDVSNVLDRKPGIRESRPKAFVRQRLADAANRLSLAGHLAARVELVNEALCRLVELLYQPDTDNLWANIDSTSYRLLIPAPWGAAGWRYYGLRKWEGRALNRILRTRLDAWTPAQRPPLFNYDAGCWYLNVPDYGTLDAALWWVKHSQITLKEWRRQYAGSYPNK
jgi:hypothetical protein